MRIQDAYICNLNDFEVTLVMLVWFLLAAVYKNMDECV